MTRGQTIVAPLSSINNGPAKQLKTNSVGSGVYRALLKMTQDIITVWIQNYSNYCYHLQCATQTLKIQIVKQFLSHLPNCLVFKQLKLLLILFKDILIHVFQNHFEFQPNNTNYVKMYSPSCCSKPKRLFPAVEHKRRYFEKYFH